MLKELDSKAYILNKKQLRFTLNFAVLDKDKKVECRYISFILKEFAPKIL